MTPTVLLVTGAYHPQISASAVQCRAIARALVNRVKFRVLTTATDRTLPAREFIDGVTVHRVLVDGTRRRSLAPIVGLSKAYLLGAANADLVHIHGVSRKNVVITALARMTRRPVIVTLHTAGQDEPEVIRREGRAAWWSFRNASRVVSVSAHLTERYLTAGLPAERLVEIPNGVDVDRFHPSDEGERTRLKGELGFRCDRPLVLFVGFFSRDKRPEVLFDAWLRHRQVRPTTLVFVGAKGPSYHEIDPALIHSIRQRAISAGAIDDLHFVDPTFEIEKYFRAADCYVLPSAREAMPLALLEAMACGVPSIATRLPGVTDRLITDRVNGLLVDVDDDEALPRALEDVLGDTAWSADIGAAARQTVTSRYSIQEIAERWVELYKSRLAC